MVKRCREFWVMKSKILVLLFIFLVGMAGLANHIAHSADANRALVDDAKEVTQFGINKEDELLPFTKASTEGYKIEKQGDSRFNIYFSDQIGRAGNYSDLMKGLRALPNSATVVIYLANFGGYVHSGVQIINAMKDSRANIITKVVGPTYSMGALIACAGDKVIVDDYAWLMFHHYSGSFSGKGSESREMIKAFDTLGKTLMKQECVAKGILTNEQVQDINNGIDVYIHGSDI